MKEFVVVKDFRRCSVGNPSQQQKFTSYRVVLAVFGARAAVVTGGTLKGQRRQRLSVPRAA
jgi:hypothetical protein